MTHTTTVGMTGHFEHAWTWAWRCDCGERGILLLSEDAARAEAGAHATCFCGQPDNRERVHRAHACEPWVQREVAGERQRSIAWAEARRDHIKDDSGACRVCGTAYPCLVIQYVQPAANPSYPSAPVDNSADGNAPSPTLTERAE